MTAVPGPALPEQRRRVLLAAVTLALATTLAAGGCQRASQGAPLPAGAPEVGVTMSEYRFDFARPVPAGRVVFRVRNTGDLEHRLTLVPLPEDLPPLDAQLRGPTRRPLDPFAGITERQPAGRPGDSGMFAADLVAGRRYGMVCFVTDPDGQNHALKGMNAEFRAGGEAKPG